MVEVGFGNPSKMIVQTVWEQVGQRKERERDSVSGIREKAMHTVTVEKSPSDTGKFSVPSVVVTLKESL